MHGMHSSDWGGGGGGGGGGRVWESQIFYAEMYILSISVDCRFSSFNMLNWFSMSGSLIVSV
jgi:hypothetical protein